VQSRELIKRFKTLPVVWQVPKIKVSFHNAFSFDLFCGGMNRGYNVVHIADVVSAIMPEIVLFPLIN
jgi:hypothetical protein